MPKSAAHAAMLSSTPDEVEHAFYEALHNADIEQLMACWADEDDIVCVHPGGPRVVGAGAIRAAFDTIFGAAGAIRVRAEHVRKVDTMAAAVHSVLEHIELMTEDGPQQATVIATNVYHKTPKGWRLVVHHASPGAPGPAQEVNQTPQLLH